MSASSSFQNAGSAGPAGFQAGNGEDPNSGNDVKPVSIFSNDYKKHDDLKQMLDSNKDNLKLEAMKRIVAMIAKGRNASDLFPAVVKNVVSKNVEIKKLVYVYLMRYAEEQQDLALLSISTFQRALKDPNQLIRASALRVLSSIRVPIIVTILMLAIKEAVSDMSPYVRKTAANAITKLYSLDPELKEDLVGIIEKLLADKTILVAGSAIQAFEEVCPERIDLIHKNYRKLCNLLIDVDEWGQIVILNMLTRYARTQFLNPNAAPETSDEKTEQEDGDENDDDEDFDAKFGLGDNSGQYRKPMDPDHRLLLRVTKPLLQSRNSAVVMAVAQLYFYIGPANEIQIIAKPMVRLLRSHREVQIIVLKNIVSLAQKNNSMFQAHQKSFYVHSNDSIHIKLLKLEILTCLANESNISVLLREFQAYVLSHDKEFAAAAIHAIGRCASTIKEVADSCLSGLVSLMSKKDETIVAESVVVIKRLLQLNPTKNGHIIKKMAKMTDKVTVPMARASILWLIGEYSDRVNKIAPDVLRKMAKTFCDEENVVKLQILNLSVKLYMTNQKQVVLLVQYIFNLAKYDQNYDIRDRARFLRALLINNEKCPTLASHLKKILLAPKPAPVLQSIYKDSDQFQLTTLSHAISARVSGYVDLPDFPTEAPDPTVRNVEIPVDSRANSISVSSKSPQKKKSDKFYSDEEDDDKSQSTEGADPSNAEDEDVDEDEDEESGDEDESKKGSSAESESESESEEDDEDEKSSMKASAKKKSKHSGSEESETEKSETEESSSESEGEDKKTNKKPTVPDNRKKVVASSTESESESDTEKSSSSDDDDEDDEEEVKAKSSSDSESEKSSAKVAKPASKASKPAAPSTPPTPVKSKVQPESASGKLVKQAQKPPAKNQEVSLLDLDFSEPSGSLTATSSGMGLIQPASAVLSPSLAADLATLSSSSSMTNFAGLGRQNYVSKKDYELLSKINGNGIQISYRFPRTPNPNSNKMTTIELVITNTSNGDFNSMTITNKKLQAGMSMTDMSELSLPKGATINHQIGIDFNDTTQPAQFELTGIYSNDPLLGGTSTTKKWSNLSITCPIGELLSPGWSISESEFNKQQAKLKGMNEVNAIVDELTHAQFISKNLTTKLLENVNMCQIPSSQQDTIKFAGLTMTSKMPLLLSLYFPSGSTRCQLNVNCEKIVLANMFIKEIKQLVQ